MVIPLSLIHRSIHLNSSRQIETAELKICYIIDTHSFKTETTHVGVAFSSPYSLCKRLKYVLQFYHIIYIFFFSI